MNIFVVSPEPRDCAEALDDIRLRKMALETAQILSTVLGVGYRKTHAAHPVVKWAGSTAPRTAWTLRLFSALGAEYGFRFSKQHKSLLLLPQFCVALPTGTGPVAAVDVEPFQNSAQNSLISFTHLPVHEAYRAYLNWKWQRDPTVSNGSAPQWTRRGPPWFRAQVPVPDVTPDASRPFENVGRRGRNAKV